MSGRRLGTKIREKAKRRQKATDKAARRDGATHAAKLRERRAAHWRKTGVSAATVKWMRDNYLL